MACEILSLTVREEAATVYGITQIASALEKARADFPDYKLETAEIDTGFIVRTKGMRVQRWLRA